MPVVGIGMAGDNRRRRDELLEGESIMRCSQDVQRTAWLLVLAVLTLALHRAVDRGCLALEARRLR